ncbi:uncharacterized protein BJX67DRAFT_322301 [Aspergillus lucknowensis]|uniref:NRDE-2, necessary for RNA interference-domain-containing protein n=1 Tax=Aspergillus lucknowensis TaxID=176173 RepID=A0ABR4LZ55_9EURO
MDSSVSQEKKTIPRFASFQPPPAPSDSNRRSELPKRKRESENPSRRQSKDRSRHGILHGHRSRSRERRNDRRDSNRDRIEARRHDREPSRAPTPSRSTVREPVEDPSDLYVVDRKGDKYNLIYGTIHRYSVPQYYRIGRGRVLGMSPNYRIDRETVGENEIVVKSNVLRTDASKAKAKRLSSASNRLPPRLLRVRPTSFAKDPIKSADDFVPLSVSRHQPREHDVDGSDTENEKFGYRSIRGKLKHDEGLLSDLEPMSDTESSGDEGARQDPDAEIQKRSVELSRIVGRRPTDVEAWLQLIDHQEIVLKGSAKQTGSLTSAERISLADIKLSIYEKALRRIGPQVAGRDRLLIGLLEEGSKVWDTQKLLSRWHSTLKSNPQHISLWVNYLDFRQTEFLNFTRDRCLATFTECLALNKASPHSPEKVRVQIYLFLRLTLFLREAGFMEQAIGLWQAVLELIFFYPQALDTDSADNMLSDFTDFWDSEVARVGDLGAKGWKNNNGTSLAPKVFEPQEQLNSKALMASWAKCERERMMNAQLPARSFDEPEDDPYRVVLASDLRQFLPLTLFLNSTGELVDGFLYFCQLPPIVTVSNLRTTGQWMGDSFLRNEVAANSYSLLDDWIPTFSNNTELGAHPTLFPNQLLIHDFDTYFANPETWYSSFRPWAKATTDVVCDWVRRTLRLLVEDMPANEDLAEYTVSVEFFSNPMEAKKYAKSLLKKRSTSLRLYNAYALIERRAGNHAVADHVWATAISMCKTFPKEQQADSIRLWHTWIWELLEARNIAHAAHLLTCMPQNNIDPKTFSDVASLPEFSSTNLLKIRNYLSEAQESAIANQKPSIVKACADCQSILLYITNAQDLEKSLEAYNLTMNRLSSLPITAEPFISYTMQLLHQSRARFVYYHLRTSTLYKPSSIRTVLSESIKLFPHNTIFLSLFTWNESRFRIEERVRDIMRDVTQTPNNPSSLFAPSTPQFLPTSQTQIPVTTHLFSIYTELSRPLYAGSTLHSVRAAFERALRNQNPSSSSSSSSSSSGSSITLWKLYILLELSRNEITRAKNVFYRAMRACPWSKDILMLAFSHLREDAVRAQNGDIPLKGEGMNFHELRNVYNVLVEKELRIHIDIERELDDLAARMEERSVALGVPISMPDDAESGDEEMQM